MPDGKRPDDELDPGAYIGREPEREAETIPGGVSPRDERTSANDSRPGVEGEPDVSDVVEGEVGSAKLVEPSTILDRGAERDAFPDVDVSDASPAKDR